MAQGVQLGRNCVLQSWSGAWYTVMGLQLVGLTSANTVVDATSTRSGGWRQILSDCGNQTVTITGSGIFKGDNGLMFIQAFNRNHSIQPYQLLFPDGTWWTGSFMVSKLEYKGTFNGARTYDITLESSGQINFFGAFPG